MVYRVVFSLVVYVGATQTLDLVWNLSDIANGLMAIPNLIALLALSGVVVRETEKYFDHLKTGKDYEEYEDLDPSLASAKAQPEVEE